MMSKPDDLQILRLFSRLRILVEEESEKATIRFREASGGLPLIEFLLDGGYLGRLQIARLHAMRSSDGGDLYADERAALDYVCDQIPLDRAPEESKGTTVQRSVRAKTLTAVPQPPTGRGSSG